MCIILTLSFGLIFYDVNYQGKMAFIIVEGLKFLKTFLHLPVFFYLKKKKVVGFFGQKYSRLWKYILLGQNKYIVGFWSDHSSRIEFLFVGFFKDLALFNGLFQYCFKEIINEASWDQYAFL